MDKNIPSAPLPLYQSHKKVNAVKIDAIEFATDGTAKIACADIGGVLTVKDYRAKFKGDDNDLGYYVLYADGYSSWSPSKSFEDGYTRLGGDPALMSFSTALMAVRAGQRAARVGWNGKNMFIFLVPGSRFKVNREPLLSILGEDTEVDYHGHIDMRTATGQIVPWLASQTDVLADDWMLV